MNPKVFQVGTLTIVTSKTEKSVYLGVYELKLFQSFSINFDKDKETPIVSIKYNYNNNDPEIQLKIEEEMRCVKAAGWLD